MSPAISFVALARLGSTILFLLCIALQARAEQQVLASIKPLALIAEQVVGEQGTAETLLKGSASPHDYPMRVSDIRRLQAADLVLWVGPEMETFLTRPLANLSRHKVMEAQQLDGIQWPSGDSGNYHGDHFHERDPHIWLNPRNGAVIALALAQRLAELDPEKAGVYRANAEALAAELEQLDQDLLAQLESLAGRGFVVYHEGYSHFVQRYGLTQLGHVTFGPEQRPGARHLHRLRQRMGDAVCVFIEPYYDTSSAREMARELGLRLGELDPLGARDVATYPELIKSMAKDFSDCLAPQS